MSRPVSMIHELMTCEMYNKELTSSADLHHFHLHACLPTSECYTCNIAPVYLKRRRWCCHLSQSFLSQYIVWQHFLRWRTQWWTMSVWHLAHGWPPWNAQVVVLLMQGGNRAAGGQEVNSLLALALAKRSALWLASANSSCCPSCSMCRCDGQLCVALCCYCASFVCCSHKIYNLFTLSEGVRGDERACVRSELS